MTRINEKLGIRPAGKRSMMQLPPNRAAAAKITAAKCPGCGNTGARVSKTKGPGWLFCTWCSTSFEVTP